MLLGTLMSLRKNHTSQAVSMVLHITWLPWQKKIFGFGIGIWMPASIHNTDMQSQKAQNYFSIIR
jgi:hypothetical protein